MVWESDFESFNKTYTTMCRFADDCKRDNCTFAHCVNELKPAICLYHFSDGCSNSATQCKFSHNKVDAVKALKAYTKRNAHMNEQKSKEDEELRKEEDAALQEDATVFFHNTVVAPLLEIEKELFLQMEEEDILRDLEEQALADEVESIHEEEEEMKKSFIVFDDEDDSASELPDYETLVSTVAQQQMLIQQMWFVMTTSQLAC